MYLTRMELNPARRGTKHLLGSPQAMHAAVAHVLPPSGKEDSVRLLWRVDRTDLGALLYIQSAHEPDLTHIVEQAGWPTRSTWETRPLEPLLDAVEVGGTFSFRLAANPVRSGRRTDGGQTQRFGHVTVAQQTGWLLARAAGFGFEIPLGGDGEPAVIVREREKLTFSKGARSGRNRVTISRAVFDGRLEVVDPDALRRAILSGIGPAKAYGCGLLTLAAVRRS